MTFTNQSVYQNCSFNRRLNNQGFGVRNEHSRSNRVSHFETIQVIFKFEKETLGFKGILEDNCQHCFNSYAVFRQVDLIQVLANKCFLCFQFLPVGFILVFMFPNSPSSLILASREVSPGRGGGVSTKLS